MTVYYRAFYPAVEATIVTNADAKRFPLRDTAHKATEDARMYWHKEGQHIVPYRLNDDGTVTELAARVRRVHQVEVAK